METLRIPPGAAADDFVVRGLGMALLPALQRPKQANRLFLYSVATTLLAHLVATYGNVTPRPRRQRGGLAPRQPRRAQDAMSEQIDGNPLAAVAGQSLRPFAQPLHARSSAPPACRRTAGCWRAAWNWPRTCC